MLKTNNLKIKSITPIIAPTDKSGALGLTGLAPGEYEVSLIGEDKVTAVAVGVLPPHAGRWQRS